MHQLQSTAAEVLRGSGPKDNAIMAGSPLHEDVAAAYEVASHLCRRAATHPGSGRCAHGGAGCAE